MSRSRKPDERRLPIHPAHFERIDPDICKRMSVETGYGERFGFSDERLLPWVGGISSREELMAECDVIVLPKPTVHDLADMRHGQVLWGWPHCVQDAELTQVAIDRRLTLIAFEAMNHWRRDGSFNLHVLHKNNEIAGYASVLHALSLIGSTGDYGRRMNAVVIGFGATARGAVTALGALGISQVDILTQRDTAAVAAPIHSARIVQFDPREGDVRSSDVYTDDGPASLSPGFWPSTTSSSTASSKIPIGRPSSSMPRIFPSLAPGTLVIDVSCDEGMGFSWARPTSFNDPMFVVGDNVQYYAVDHSPSYLWNSATWEVSEALMPHIETVLAGPAAWEQDETIRRAIEIQDGVIRNPSILAFQSRAAEYPHERRA